MENIFFGTLLIFIGVWDTWHYRDKRRDGGHILISLAIKIAGMYFLWQFVANLK